MASQIPGKALLLNDYGITVNRAAATLPQTATTNYFQITGGRVIVTNLIGSVTVATGATATTLAINYLNSASTACWSSSSRSSIMATASSVSSCSAMSAT